MEFGPNGDDVNLGGVAIVLMNGEKADEALPHFGDKSLHAVEISPILNNCSLDSEPAGQGTKNALTKIRFSGTHRADSKLCVSIHFRSLILPR
jgi:hypothetical protein